jgi:hypothetical protein
MIGEKVSDMIKNSWLKIKKEKKEDVSQLKEETLLVEENEKEKQH